MEQNIGASNGIVHVVDTLLLPDLPTIYQVAHSTKTLTKLVKAIDNVGLVDKLNGTANFTVFAPNDGAFQNLPMETLSGLFKPENKNRLKGILLTHILDTVINAEDIENGVRDIKTVGGGVIKMKKLGNTVTIETSQGTAKVIDTLIEASNGIIHVVDTVLMPEPASIYEIANRIQNLSTLLTALQKAGLENTLNGTGNYTVFAPNNAAFKKLTPEKLTELLQPENKNTLNTILLTHVVDLYFKAEDNKNVSANVITVGGETLKVSKSGNIVIVETSEGEATVIDQNFEARNGILHVIDTVLLTKPRTIYEVANRTKNLITFVKALDTAGLANKLNCTGKFTVFAPNDEAFEKLSSEKVADLLKPKNEYIFQLLLLTHVVDGVHKAENIPNSAFMIETVGGEEITLMKPKETIIVETSRSKANVIVTNIEATNGIVHVIDTVLLPEPPTIFEISKGTRFFSNLTVAIEHADLVNTLNGNGNFTVFAPNDNAFAKLAPKDLDELLNPRNKKKLRDILLTHVLNTVIRAEDIKDGLQKIKTVGGTSLTVKKSEGAVTVETSQGMSKVTDTNIEARNGIVHVIDSVLEPDLPTTTTTTSTTTTTTTKTTTTTPTTIITNSSTITTAKVPEPTIYQVANKTKYLSILVLALQKADLAKTLSSNGTLTLFAPNNVAFKKIPKWRLNELLKQKNKEKLREILLTHVLDTVIKSEAIGDGSTKLNTIGGEIITVTKTRGKVTVETTLSKATVVEFDTDASNGVIHVIDTVLEPGRKW